MGLRPFAGAFAQLECLGIVPAGSPDLNEIGVLIAHCPIAHGKIRVELDAALMVRQGCAGTFLAQSFLTKAVGLKRLKRGRCGLFERNIELQHRGQRFAQFAAQLGCGRTEPSSTFSLVVAVTCCCASVSPLWQFTAFSPSTYSVPRLAIDPPI